MCGVKFWNGNENLRSVYKNRFSKYWTVSSIFDLSSSQSPFSEDRDKNFFSLNRSNGVSKNPSFHTDFKNVQMSLVKSASKNFFLPKIYFTNWKFARDLKKKSVFWAKLFLCALFTNVICISEISMKDELFDTPFDLIKEKKISSHCRVNVYF